MIIDGYKRKRAIKGIKKTGEIESDTDCWVAVEVMIE